MSKQLVIGNGFFAQNYVSLERNDAGSDAVQVHQASRHPENHQGPDGRYVDMLDPESILAVIEEVKPDVIINGAAILGRNGDRHKLGHNTRFVCNLIDGVHALGIHSRIVTLGSAAVYGIVNEHDLPVNETAPMQPDEGDLYGQSKMNESMYAHYFADGLGVNLVEARLFNPLGPGLHPSNLIARVMAQVRSIRSGEQDERTIRVRNLSAARDYSHVTDLVRGISTIAHAPDEALRHRVYNVGSGVRTSNRQLIDLFLYHTGVDAAVEATDTRPEPVVGAAQADVTRLYELGWRRQYTVDQAVAATVAELAA